MFFLPSWLKDEILNGPLFWAHYTPSKTNFGRSPGTSWPPTRSVPPLFGHGVLVFISADKAEHLAQHFERTHHLNLNVSTANHACMVNCTINNFFHHPHSHLTEAQLSNPYELQHLIHSLNTKSAPGTDGISTTMLQNFSHTALIHLTQLFNHILRFWYFSSTWKSAKFIPILKPGKPLSDPSSYRPINLLSTVSKLLEWVVAHRLNSCIHQNHILSPEQFGFCKQHSTVSQLARITDFITHDFDLWKHTGMVLLGIKKVYGAIRLNGLLFKLISLYLLNYLLFFLSPSWKVVPILFTWMTLHPPQNLPPVVFLSMLYYQLPTTSDSQVSQLKCLQVISSHPRWTPNAHLHYALNIEPITIIIHWLTDKYFAHCPSHPNPLVQQIRNYALADLTNVQEIST